MKIKKTFGVALLLSAFVLSACNNTNSKPEESKPVSSNQPAQSEPAAKSSEPAAQSSVNQQSVPVSQPVINSSTPETPSSNPWSGWQPSFPTGSENEDSQPRPQPQANVYTVTAFEFEKDANNKVSLVVKGTLDDDFDKEFTWAWGLVANGNEEEFIVGSAEPAESDFKAVTVNEKAFEVKLNLSDIQGIKAGEYLVYGGNPDSYIRISPIDEVSTAKDGNFKYFLRSDTAVSGIVLSELPVVAFEDAIVYNPGVELPTGKTEGIYVKIGGAVKAGVNVDELVVKADFQNIRSNAFHPASNGWNQPKPDFPENEMFWTKDEANSKAYINLYIGFMAAGEQWATHLGFNTTGNSNPNCFIDKDIDNVEYRFADEDINKVYTVNAKESEGQQGTYWGCLGFAVTQEHDVEPQPQPQPQTDAHTWVAGADGVNSDSKVIKNYTCSDADCNAIAAGIAFTDYDAADAEKVDAEGKIGKSVAMHWKIVSPKAGACKLMMASKLSQNYVTYNASHITFDEGYVIKAGDNVGTVTMSGKEYERDFGMNSTDFVYYEVGTLTVALGENVITFETVADQSYRLAYGGEVRLVFED